MTAFVLAVAKRMGQQSDWRLTNLALQKLTYIAHMVCLGRHDRPLVYGTFQAWNLGPVHPDLYRAVSRFGSSHVSIDVFQSIRSVHQDPEASLIDDVVKALSDSTPRLVAITHWEKGAWAKHYQHGRRGIEIPNRDILQEYKDRLREPQR